jgi:hypothetical protein
VFCRSLCSPDAQIVRTNAALYNAHDGAKDADIGTSKASEPSHFFGGEFARQKVLGKGKSSAEILGLS